MKLTSNSGIYIGFSIMVLGAIFLFSLPEHASIVMLFVATAHNPKLTTTLLNQISDGKALKNIPVNLIAPLRHTLFNGMHLLALISGLLLFIALFVNWLDPWKKSLE
ncbi:hypothetical protein [Lactococcus cremoris]|uniref:hypothetical protein n=1 Tax=Lactococcus lactis subsp. cremoris TaxID=1359 RepID=UPI00296F6C24|nr:hypothetical protein [Lactococcus cremoris]WKC57206.1 hypothetical protein LLUC073_01210 [Lactococcus cremoris]